MLYEVTWLPHCPIRLVYSLCMDEPEKGTQGPVRLLWQEGN